MKYNNDNLSKGISAEVQMDDYERERKAKKEKLMKKLGDNPIAKMMEEKQDKREEYEERDENWQPIDYVMWAARDLYMEEGNIKSVISSLIDALGKLKGEDEESIS